MSAPLQHTEKLLAFSVEQYRELFQHAEKLLEIIDTCAYAKVSEHAAKLQELQAAAIQQDELLMPLFNDQITDWTNHTLYRTRHEFINTIIKLNELILPKIHGMMAATSAELGQMQGSRVAVVGYTSPKTDQRGLRGIG